MIHTHTQAGIAVSAQELGLLPLSQHAMRFWGNSADHDYEGLSLELDEQARLTRDLGELEGPASHARAHRPDVSRSTAWRGFARTRDSYRGRFVLSFVDVTPQVIGIFAHRLDRSFQLTGMQPQALGPVAAFPFIVHFDEGRLACRGWLYGVARMIS